VNVQARQGKEIPVRQAFADVLEMSSLVMRCRRPSEQTLGVATQLGQNRFKMIDVSTGYAFEESGLDLIEARSEAGHYAPAT